MPLASAKASPTKNPVALANGLPDAPVLTARAARDSGMAFLDINVTRRNSGVTASLRDEAFLILMQMRRESDFDLYADGRLIRPVGFRGGEIAIFDLRHNIASDTRDPYRALDFYLPRKALKAMGDNGEIPRHIEELRQPLGTSVADPVVRNLLLAMRPALAAPPEETPDLFVDHIALALAIHLATRYGDGGAAPAQWQGGLAPWQLRRARELVEAGIAGGVTLNALAAACELSTRHFARAFRQSTGMAPYQWLQHRRMEKAKDLLEHSPASLSDIALQCGFSDQSHFTRIFSRLTGTTPRTWRRTRHD